MGFCFGLRGIGLYEDVDVDLHTGCTLTVHLGFVDIITQLDVFIDHFRIVDALAILVG